MAGDWMKVELELPDKPEVHALAGILCIDPDLVVGKLLRVWQWFDKHTVDGNAFGVTYLMIDRITSVAGFGEAMMFVGWLEQNDKVLTMPKFDRHTSASAKQRALTAKRVAKKRNANSNDESVTLALAREEKRREDININTGESSPKNSNPEKPKTSKQKNKKTPLPESFTISEKVTTWATSHGYGRLEERLSHFVGTAKANGYTYVDWDQAFMNAIRDDWARPNGKPCARASPDCEILPNGMKRSELSPEQWAYAKQTGMI